jgi:hypothetical protein
MLVVDVLWRYRYRMDLGDLLAVDASTLTVVDAGLGAIAVD